MKSILTFSLLFVSFLLSAQQTFIYCGNLVDVEKGKVLSEKTIIVEDDLIKDIKKGKKTFLPFQN